MSFILKVDSKVNFLALLSLMIVVSTDIWWSRLPEFFTGGSELLNSIYNVCIGFIISYIFYLLVVHLPECRNREHINTVIKPLLVRILDSQREINETEILISQGRDFRDINFNLAIPNEVDFEPSGSKWIIFLLRHIESINHDLSILEKFYPHMGAELIEKCESIHRSKLWVAIKCIHVLDDPNAKYDMGKIEVFYKHFNEQVSRLKSP